MGVRRLVTGRPRLRVAVLTCVLVGSGLAAAGQASAASNFSLVAGVSHTQYNLVPAPAEPGVDLHQAVPATDTQAGYQGWAFSLTNTTDGVPVTAPAITVDSGWAPADCPGLAEPTTACPGGDVTPSGTAFPITWTDDALLLPGQAGPPVVCAPNQMRVEDLSLDAFFTPTGEGNPPLSFQPGFDSFRSLDTTTVAPGGTQQMTTGVTVRDASYTRVEIRVFVLMTLETVTSITPPAGLPPCPPNPGTTTCLLVVGQSAQGAAVTINHPVPGTEYLFSATFTNGGPTPVDLVPDAQVGATRQTTTPVPLAGTSTQVAAPSLDGPTPGSGTVGFGVGPGQVAERPGNSAGPPATVPEYMPVLVTSAVIRSGSTISGTTTSLVIVRTDPGYAGSPGHAGTGTLVAVLPC